MGLQRGVLLTGPDLTWLDLQGRSTAGSQARPACSHLLFFVSYCLMFLMKCVFFRPLCLGDPDACLVL